MSRRRPDQNDGQWHLDKRVPLALLLAIGIQTGAGIWWASRTDARVDALERQVLPVATQAERIIRLETKVDVISENIAEIRNIVRKEKR